MLFFNYKLLYSKLVSFIKCLGKYPYLKDIFLASYILFFNECNFGVRNPKKGKLKKKINKYHKLKLIISTNNNFILNYLRLSTTLFIKSINSLWESSGEIVELKSFSFKVPKTPKISINLL